MRLQITSIDELIDFVKTYDLELRQLNEILCNTIGSIFINDHPLEKRGEYLQTMLKHYPHERRVFIDLEDIGVSD